MGNYVRLLYGLSVVMMNVECRKVSLEKRSVHFKWQQVLSMKSLTSLFSVLFIMSEVLVSSLHAPCENTGLI